MDTATLFNELKAAYTEKNLHKISSQIIEMFRDRKYDAVRYIQKIVNQHTPCAE